MECTLVFLMPLLVACYSQAGSPLEKSDRLHKRTHDDQPIECRVTELGLEYMGKMKTTASGKECQPWNSESDLRPTYPDEYFPDGSREAAANYCRNPGERDGGPGCYIGDGPEWESCDIPFCDIRSRQVSACEHTLVIPKCADDRKIYVINAFYGRGLTDICQDPRIKTRDCSSNRAIKVFRERCNGKRFCSMPAENRVFSDPCVGTFKYMELEYSCVK